MKGIDSFTKSAIGHWVIEQVVNIIEPNGGVIPPIIMFTIVINPK